MISYRVYSSLIDLPCFYLVLLIDIDLFEGEI